MRAPGRGGGEFAIAPAFPTHTLVCIICKTGSWVLVSFLWPLLGAWPVSHSDPGSRVGPSLPPEGELPAMSSPTILYSVWTGDGETVVLGDCCHPQSPAFPAHSPLRKL